MDYIRSFDIQLAKDVYYAGELLAGHVVLENTENIKIRGIRVVLRGKAHAEWKIMKSGERRTVKDDQYLLDDKAVIWGKDKHEDDGVIPILPRGVHQLPFKFNLPQTALPCSFESKAGTIRYYIKVVIDIPYASPPQGIKYFTVIGPHIDCMEEKYLTPMVGQDKKTVCCLCCQRGPIGLRVTLERTAYICNDNIRLHALIDNQSDQSCCVKIKLMQYVEYFIDKGVLGVNKNLSYAVLEHRSPQVQPYSTGKYDSTLEQPIKLPVVPPTLIGVCRLIQIYYVLKACLELEKSGDDLLMDFPFTVATVPFRIPNSTTPPEVEYEFCSTHVEGGMYISPEFQLGQVYDGTLADDESVLLYRPVYVRLSTPKPIGGVGDKSSGGGPSTSGISTKGTRQQGGGIASAASRTIRKQSAPVNESLSVLNTSTTALSNAHGNFTSPSSGGTILHHHHSFTGPPSPAMVTALSKSGTISPATESAITAPSTFSTGSVSSVQLNSVRYHPQQHQQQQHNVQQVVVDLHDVRLLNTCGFSSSMSSAASTSALNLAHVVNGQPTRKASMTLLTSADDDQALVTFSEPLLYNKQQQQSNTALNSIQQQNRDGGGTNRSDHSGTSTKDTDRLLQAKSVHKISITTPQELR